MKWYKIERMQRLFDKEIIHLKDLIKNLILINKSKKLKKEVNNDKTEMSLKKWLNKQKCHIFNCKP